MPVIGFPRGGRAHTLGYAEATGVDAVSASTQDVPLAWAATCCSRNVAVQGNLDPLLLVAGGEALERAVRAIARGARRRAASSSTSAMASCRRRRRSMSPRELVRAIMPAR